MILIEDTTTNEKHEIKRNYKSNTKHCFIQHLEASSFLLIIFSYSTSQTYTNSDFCFFPLYTPELDRGRTIKGHISVDISYGAALDLNQRPDTWLWERKIYETDLGENQNPEPSTAVTRNTRSDQIQT